MNAPIAVIVLSAGASSRMQQPKGLLMLDGKSFLNHIADAAAAADIHDAVIVLGADRDAIRKTLGWFTGSVVVNKEWETGQLSSIITGINAVENSGCGGVLVWPVDHPLIPVPLIEAMVRAFKDSAKPIVLPTYRGRRGHPIILSRVVFDDVRRAPADIGLRAVVQTHDHDICEVATDEEGVLLNIDTPEEYRRCVTQREGRGR